VTPVTVVAFVIIIMRLIFFYKIKAKLKELEDKIEKKYRISKDNLRRKEQLGRVSTINYKIDEFKILVPY
jgi:predicted Holliday junction resolvase-like endonuclease